MDTIKEARYNLGIAYLNDAQYNEAIPEFEAVIKLDANYIEAHCGLSRVYLELNELDKAEISALTALRLNSDYSAALSLINDIKDVHCDNGITYLNDERYSDAVAAFQNVITLDPDFTAAHFNLGMTYLKIENYPRAIGALQKTINLDRTHKVAYHTLALAYFGQHELENARNAAKDALKIDVNYQPARSLLEAIDPNFSGLSTHTSTATQNATEPEIGTEENNSFNETKQNRPTDNETKQNRPIDNEVDNEAKQNRPIDNEAKQNRPIDNEVDNEAKQNRPTDNEAKQNRPIDNETKQNRPIDNEAKQNRPTDNEAKQNRPTDNETKQNRPIDNEAKQNRPIDNEAKQNRPIESKSETAEVKDNTQKNFDVKKDLDHGLIYLSNKQYNKAAATFKRVIKTDPNCINAYNGLAETYLEIEAFGDAKAAVEEALKIDRNNQTSHELLQTIHLIINLKRKQKNRKKILFYISIVIVIAFGLVAAYRFDVITIPDFFNLNNHPDPSPPNSSPSKLSIITSLYGHSGKGFIDAGKTATLKLKISNKGSAVSNFRIKFKPVSIRGLRFKIPTETIRLSRDRSKTFEIKIIADKKVQARNTSLEVQLVGEDGTLFKTEKVDFKIMPEGQEPDPVR